MPFHFSSFQLNKFGDVLQKKNFQLHISAEKREREREKKIIRRRKKRKRKKEKKKKAKREEKKNLLDCWNRSIFPRLLYEFVVQCKSPFPKLKILNLVLKKRKENRREKKRKGKEKKRREKEKKRKPFLQLAQLLDLPYKSYSSLKYKQRKTSILERREREKKKEKEKRTKKEEVIREREEKKREREEREREEREKEPFLRLAGANFLSEAFVSGIVSSFLNFHSVPKLINALLRRKRKERERREKKERGKGEKREEREEKEKREQEKRKRGREKRKREERGKKKKKKKKKPLINKLSSEIRESKRRVLAVGELYAITSHCTFNSN